MPSRLFNTGTPQQTVGWERLPLLASTARQRRFGRAAWFAIGVLIGLMMAALI